MFVWNNGQSEDQQEYLSGQQILQCQTLSFQPYLNQECNEPQNITYFGIYYNGVIRSFCSSYLAFTHHKRLIRLQCRLEQHSPNQFINMVMDTVTRTIMCDLVCCIHNHSLNYLLNSNCFLLETINKVSRAWVWAKFASFVQQICRGFGPSGSCSNRSDATILVA